MDKLSETAQKFGLGKKVFDNLFNNEKKGLVPNTSWKKNILGESWLLGETMITGIGQGYIQTTPIQLCLMTAQIANGPKYRFAGKTGTAQVKRISKKDRELDLKTFEIPYEDRDHALYIAFGPYINPRYALSILIEHGGSGSSVAAPMAKKLFKKIIDRHQTRREFDNKEYLNI